MLGLILKGMAMGIAEVIPGVSGGSIALITGIYETLLKSINGVDFGLIKTFKKDSLSGVAEKINLPFLIKLFAGMGVGVLVGVFAISHLIETNPQLLWGFFFGLILASSVMIFNMIEKKSMSSWLLFAVGAIVAYGVTMVSPQAGTDNLIYVFFCGMIAICALILPGISGSFILLLLGMYTVVVNTVKGLLVSFSMDSLILVAVFAIGCLVGLKSFSKLVSWTYNTYRSHTLAIMAGFMLGSLNKIWPWKNVTSILEKSTGTIISDNAMTLIQGDKEAYKIISEQNILPAQHTDPQTMAVVGLFIVSIVLIYLFDRYSRNAGSKG